MTGEVALDPRVARGVGGVDLDARHPLDALSRLPLTLNSSLDLSSVLDALIEASLAVSHADRCSIFLLRNGGRLLEPTVAVGRLPDEDLWAKFRTLAPLEVPVALGVHRDLRAGKVVAISDAAKSPVIPPALVETFSLRSVTLVPLLGAGELTGLLAVDYQHQHSSTPDELTALALLGSYAGLSVRNARLYGEERRRAKLHQALALGAAELSSGDDAIRICHALTRSFRSMLDADLCGIGILDDDDTTLHVVRTNGDEFDLPAAEVSKSLLRQASRRWSAEITPMATDSPWLAGLTRLNGPRSRHMLVPLVVRRRVRGVVYVGFADKSRIGADEEAAASGLAAIASAALERAQLLTMLRQQVARLEVLYHLGEIIGASSAPNALRRRLNTLLDGTGSRVEAIQVSDRRIRSRLGWPTDGGVPNNAVTGAVPLRSGRRVIGALHVSPVPDPDDGFVAAVAAGVAEALARGAARVAAQESARGKALDAERERISLDLHDTVGQSFVATMLLARRAAEELPADSEWAQRFERIAEVASEGKWSLDAAVRALAFVPAARAGLSAALRAFCRSVAQDSGLHVEFHVTGRVRRLPVSVERALYRVGHQAVSNAWRHARASVVTVSLDYLAEEIRLVVQDNGIGLTHRQDGALATVGFTSMRRAVTPLGGHVSVENVAPSGVKVNATVPRRQS